MIDWIAFCIHYYQMFGHCAAVSVWRKSHKFLLSTTNQ